MSVGTAPVRPAGLQGLKESAQPLASEQRAFCGFHGALNGLNCPECDKHYPADVIAARTIGAAPLSMGILPEQVQAMIDAAVKQALGEQVAFMAWKNSPAGQEAAAVAKTAGIATPDHAVAVGDPVSTPVPVGPTVPTLAEWEAAGYPATAYDEFVARFKPVA